MQSQILSNFTLRNVIVIVIGCVPLFTASTGSTANDVPIWAAVHYESTAANV